MSTSYLLEHEGEFNRLERQSEQPHYNIASELRFLDLKEGMKVLDAGCGSGLLSRYLVESGPKIEVNACDFSDLRLKQARDFSQKSGHKEINYFRSKLDEIDIPDNSLDRVVCRFVYEYLPNPVAVTQEFFRILKPGGRAYLIDLDGIFLNFWTANDRLNFLIEKLRKNLNVDLYVGRKLSSFLQKSSFSDINWDSTNHNFISQQDLKDEYQNNVDRLTFGKQYFIEALGNEKTFKEFEDLYLSEMKKDGSALFFNKFISWGTKPRGPHA